MGLGSFIIKPYHRSDAFNPRIHIIVNQAHSIQKCVTEFGGAMDRRITKDGVIVVPFLKLEQAGKHEMHLP